MRLIIQAIKNDLMSRSAIFVSLAMQCIANIGGQEMLENVGVDVPKILISGYENSFPSLIVIACSI